MPDEHGRATLEDLAQAIAEGKEIHAHPDTPAPLFAKVKRSEWWLRRRGVEAMWKRLAVALRVAGFSNASVARILGKRPSKVANALREAQVPYALTAQGWTRHRQTEEVRRARACVPRLRTKSSVHPVR